MNALYLDKTKQYCAHFWYWTGSYNKGALLSIAMLISCSPGTDRQFEQREAVVNSNVDVLFSC